MEKKTQINIRVSDKFKEDLKEVAWRRRLDMTGAIEEAVKIWINLTDDERRKNNERN